MLLLALCVALILRFYRLDHYPPGLYRDEAINGLDALRVLRGEHAIFFPANNGREPLYIYLAALAIALFGQTAFALRFVAALVGTLTIFPVYLLGKSWFSWRVGVLAAWIWAITLWPVHLSRIGLRVILLAPLLTMTLWLGTKAFREGRRSLWFLGGLLYGLTFYSYLAIRFTPVLLIILFFYVLLRDHERRLRSGVAWFALGAFLILLPFLIVVGQQPDLLLGRTAQVSILNSDVNHGDFLGTAIQHFGAALMMFIWRGDTILRHNPMGRPVFDLLMLIPFLLGLVWCLRHWRRLAPMALLLWLTIMLGPTILAADAPHFLRAAAILPAMVYLPAIGLDKIWVWKKQSSSIGSLLVIGLILGSLLITIRDYTAYAVDPQVAHAFESVATELAQQINQESAYRGLFVDERLWRDWPSVRYLTIDRENVHVFTSPSDLPSQISLPFTFFVWPYEPLDYIPDFLTAPALISTSASDLVYDELDNSAYQLYLRYEAEQVPQNLTNPAVQFEDGLTLQQADVLKLADGRLQVDVYWQSEKELDEEIVVFVHVIGADGLVGQHDGPPAAGHWQASWWQSGQVIHDRHIVALSEPYDDAQHQVVVGLYRAASGERLLAFDADTGESLGTSWSLSPN